MKYKRIILSLLLCVLFSTSNPCLFFAGGQESDVSVDYEYRILEDNSVEIIYCDGECEDLIIPSRLDGHIVTGITEFSLLGLSNLKSITFPDSINHIQGNPFAAYKDIQFNLGVDHPYLAEIEGALFGKSDKKIIYCPANKTEDIVPDGIKILGERAFTYCSGITQIDLPDSVNSIEESAFYSCYDLEEVRISNEETTIGAGAFAECKELRNVVLPSNLLSIEDKAFYNCRSLQTLTVPESVTRIGDSVFYDCVKLEDITLPENLTSIGYNAFYRCKSLENMDLPEGLISIGSKAFERCKGLRKITLPSSLIEIGDDAFLDCKDIKFTVTRDSYAEDWCIQNNMKYEYTDAYDWLNE